jgi:hypothetical protein
MSGVEGIGRVRLDRQSYGSAGTLKRRDPDGEEPRDREQRRQRPDDDTVTLGRKEDEADPELPHLTGHAGPMPPPRWDRARRF